MFKKIIKVTIYLLVFLMPLFWLPLSFEAFEFNKGYLLFFLVSIGVLAWLGKMIFQDKKISFRKKPLDIFVLVFLVIMILSAIFSKDSVSSIYGFYGRFWPSLISILSLGLFYFLVTNNVTIKSQIPNPNDQPNPKSQTSERSEQVNKKEPLVIGVQSLIKVFLWSSFFVLLIGYFSIFGLSANIGKILGFSSINFPQSFNTVGASLQQLSVFLAVVLLLLANTLAFRKKQKKNFWLYLYLLAIFVFLILVDFWPSFLIVALSLILFLGFAFWKRVFKQDVNRLSLSVLLLVISLIFLFSNPLQGVFPTNSKLGNLPEEISFSQKASWGVGWQGLKENPFLGSGPSTFNYLFSKFKPASFLNTQWWQLRFSRASNHISEMLGTTGILGILSYFALIVMFLMISSMIIGVKTKPGAFSKSKEEQEKTIEETGAFYMPLLIAFFGLLIAQFVYYQNSVLGFSFWLFLSLGVVSWGNAQNKKSFSFKDFPEVGLIASMVFWVILILAGIFYFTMVKFYVADACYRKYLINPRANIVQLERATQLNKSRTDYHIALARDYLGRISDEAVKTEPNNQMMVNLVSLALREGRKATNVSPNRISAQETLAVVYRDIQGLAQGSLEWGIKTLDTALVLEPRSPILLTELGKLKLVAGEIEEAKDLFNKALGVKENYIGAGVQLALLEEGEKNIEGAISRMEQIVQANLYSIEAHFQLGRLYYNQRENDKAISQFEDALTLFPNHSNSLYSLGLVYERKGDKGRALEQFRKVLGLNPNNIDVIARIKALEAKE